MKSGLRACLPGGCDSGRSGFVANSIRAGYWRINPEEKFSVKQTSPASESAPHNEEKNSCPSPLLMKIAIRSSKSKPIPRLSLNSSTRIAPIRILYPVDLVNPVSSPLIRVHSRLKSSGSGFGFHSDFGFRASDFRFRPAHPNRLFSLPSSYAFLCAEVILSKSGLPLPSAGHDSFSLAPLPAVFVSADFDTVVASGLFRISAVARRAALPS
jgi:hypothetical protein